jgi:uncharacterized protein (DUF302 family)/uncharacterized membrane protein YidH (DUF202 family)
MDLTGSAGPKATLSDFLAAERTLLAWIRTGLALMGFGFVVARFGVFLQEVQAAQHGGSIRLHGSSLWFGTALIAAGVLVNLFAGWRYTHLVRDLNHGEIKPSRSLSQAVAVAYILALIGLAMAIYLFLIHDPIASTQETSMSTARSNGIIDKRSNHSVDETVGKLKSTLEAKGVTLFAVIDHSGEAEKVGLKMRPTKLLIFGSPKAGTQLMLAAPSIAIDLPLKVLVWQDNDEKVWISYNSPQYLLERHNAPPSFQQTLAVVEALTANAAE